MGRGATDARDRAGFAFVFFMALQGITLVFAGILFVSEPLIQMSLFRFSIFPKLLSCVGAAALLLDPTWLARRTVRVTLFALPVLAVAAVVGLRILKPGSAAGQFVRMNLPALGVFIFLLLAAATFLCFERPRRVGLFLPSAFCILPLLMLFHPYLGLRIAVEDAEDRDYLALCAWAREHTPVDAVFVVPPNEQLFRFHARRAIVVNFKNVPQLSSEMREWRERLESVLDEPLANLPRRFDRAHAAIAARYDALPAGHLFDVARRYGAAYVVTARRLEGERSVFENASYHLYDTARKEPTPP